MISVSLLNSERGSSHRVARESKFNSLWLTTPANISRSRYCHLLFALPLCFIISILSSILVYFHVNILQRARIFKISSLSIIISIDTRNRVRIATILK